MLSGGGDIDPPADWRRVGGGFGNQMILDRLASAPAIDAWIQPLTATDVPAMLALVELTQPGPFRPRTIELGHYFGIFEDGALVAMAGERLQTPEFTEVSAVCTHPSVRGRGFAAALSHRVATGILARGQTPILHVALTNVGARRVYERLGLRRSVGNSNSSLSKPPPSGRPSTPTATNPESMRHEVHRHPAADQST